MGQNMPPDHIVRCGYAHTRPASNDFYKFHGEWQGLSANDLKPHGVGVAVIEGKIVIVGSFDSDGTVFGTPYLRHDLQTKESGVFCLDRARPDGAIFEVGVRMIEDRPDAWGVFQ